MKKDQNKKKQVLLIAVITFLMIGSVFSFFLGYGTPVALKYNGYKFEQIGNNYAVKIDGKRFFFNFFPKQLEDLKISQEMFSKLKQTPMFYFTSSVNDTFAQEIASIEFDLGNIFSKEFNKYTPTAFIEQNAFKLPVIDCSNATAAIPVVKFEEEKNATQLFVFKDTCLVIAFKNEADLLMARDRLLYGMLGVMNG